MALNFPLMLALSGSVFGLAILALVLFCVSGDWTFRSKKPAHRWWGIKVGLAGLVVAAGAYGLWRVLERMS